MTHLNRRLPIARLRGVKLVKSGFLILSVLASAIAAAADRAAPSASEKAAAELQGQWQPVSIEVDGKKLDSGAIKGQRVVFKGDEMTTDPNNVIKFKLDPSKTPAEIDFTGIAGPGKGKKAGGIYSLQKGQLTLCIPESPEREVPRPREFKTQKGDGLVLIILQRVPTAPKPHAPGNVIDMS